MGLWWAGWKQESQKGATVIILEREGDSEQGGSEEVVKSGPILHIRGRAVPPTSKTPFLGTVRCLLWAVGEQLGC